MKLGRTTVERIPFAKGQGLCQLRRPFGDTFYLFQQFVGMLYFLSISER